MKHESMAPNYIATGADVAGEFVFYSTENKQLIKMRHSAERREELGRVSYLITPFHSNHVTGITTSLRQRIFATSSLDKTIRVWQYSQSTGN